MSSRVAFALATCLALAGCDTADPGCADRSLAHIRIAPEVNGLEPPPDGAVLPGRFVTWEPGPVEFVTTDGRSFGFLLEPEDDAVVPDLAALGPVTLQGLGFGFDPFRPALPTIEVRSPRRELLVLLGTDERPDGELVQVEAPRDETRCPRRTHEDGLARNKPVYVSLGDVEERLFQGQSTDAGALRFDVLAAQSNNRSHPWAPCSEADCPWEKLSWMLWDPSLPVLE